VNEDNRIGLLAIAFIVLAVAVCIIVFALDGCANYYDPLRVFDEIPDLGIQTVQDAMDWVADEIWYVSDEIHYPQLEYWQSPLQTYVWRTGDCEDYAILALYLIHRDVGIDGELARGSYDGIGHGWVLVAGHQWEPQTAVIVDNNPLYYLSSTISYDEVIERATTTHKATQMAEKDGHNPTFLDGGRDFSSFNCPPSFFEGLKCK